MRRFIQQPALPVELVLAFAALFAVCCTQAAMPSTQQWALALALAASGVATFHFPVHVASHIKLYLTGPALFIAAIVLPPWQAAVVVLSIGLVGNVSVRARTGLTPLDIVCEGFRWGVAATAATIIVHASPHAWQPGPLLGAGVAMWAVDVLTISLLISGLDCRSVRSVMAEAMDNWKFEGALYLMGALGALDATYQPWALTLLLIPCALIYRAVQNTYELHDSTRKLIEGLADAVDMRDIYVGGHSRRVSNHARAMAEELRNRGHLGPIECELIATAARVHDVGKIEIPDAVLHQSEDLSPEERDIMELHVNRGADILQCYPNFRRGVPLVLHHHERWDGTGYPHRLSGTDIPLGARIIALADSFDAMTSDKPFRAGMSRERAAVVLRRGRGEQWDPELVDMFLGILGLGGMAHLHVVRADELSIKQLGTA